MCCSCQVGNNITGDVTKLRKDFPDLEGQFANYAELTSLTSRPATNRRLADLVAMVSNKEMDKERGGGALIDWTASSFSRDELLYASTDAWAGLFVWRAFERKKAGLVASLVPEQPEGGGTRTETGEGIPDAVSGTEAGESEVLSDVGLGGDSLVREKDRALVEEVLDDVDVDIPAADWVVAGDDDDDDDDEGEVPEHDGVQTPPEVLRRDESAN